VTAWRGCVNATLAVFQACSSPGPKVDLAVFPFSPRHCKRHKVDLRRLAIHNPF
jgi:hypothetical protein